MANQIDSLELQISADAQKAANSLKNLSSSLNSLKGIFAKDISGMRKFSKEIGTMGGALRSLGKIKVDFPDMKGLESLFKILKDVDNESASKTSGSLNQVAGSLASLGKVNFKENGINNTVNALNRLFKVDMTKFNPDDFVRITDSISKLGNMPDVSSGVNRFVSSLSRLANAGEKTGQSANSVLRLGQQTKEAAKQLQSVGAINDDVNLFVQSIGRLASAGGKTGHTASGLNALADETIKFFKAMQNAPKVSENTIRMTQALAQLATAGGKVGTTTNTVTSSFSKLASVGNKTLVAMKKVAKGITSSFKQIGGSSNHLTKAQFSLSNLLRTVLAFKVGYGLLKFGKQAFTLGSNITEVENVVDVSFGNMADKAYEFAKTAKEQFGLSELAAKQYTGTMMAMLKSSGVAKGAAADMSIGLAGLAGDLASFYNIKTDEAFYKLRAAMAGEIEPLRQLGINMTVVNLESYAMSQGITKSYQAMSQAEQQMLRYNYIMSVTGAQQGDYQRTLGTFANQWRLLTLNVQQFAATIGQGLIAAVLPAIQAINALFTVIQRAAEAFRNFMYVLTGYEPPSSGGFVNDLAGLEDIGSAGSDAASGLDDATSSAKDLKKALSVLSFDELNQLSDNSAANAAGGSIGGSGGGVGGVSPGFGGLTDLVGKSKLPEAINEWAERIRSAFLDHDWDRLGKEIAKGINKGLKKIYKALNWKKVGPKITAFTEAFTETFNSLVDYIDWDLIGRDLGAGINTIVNTLNQLIEGVDFVNIGRKLSIGLRGAISEIGWKELGNLIGNYFMISWDMLSGFVTDMSTKNGAGITGWEELGRSLGNAFNGVFQKINFGEIGATLANGINGAFQTLRNFVATVQWDDVAVNIYTGLNNMINGIEWAEAGATLSKFVTNLLGTFATVAANTDWEGFGRGIGEFLSNIDWWGILRTVVEIIMNTFGGIFDGLESSGTAGKIAAFLGRVFIVIKIANITGLSDLAGNIVSFLANKITSSENTNKLKTAFNTLLDFGTKGLSKSTATTGILGWLGKIGSSAVVTGGIIGSFTEGVKNSERMANGVDFTALSLALGYLKEDGEITTKTFDDLFLKISGAGATGENFSEFTQTIIESLEDSGVSVENFKTAFETALDEMGYSSKEKAEIIGSAIGDGMDNGLSESKGKSEGTISKWINNIVSTVKGKLEIGSPSKVFEAFGENTIQGYINGVDSKSSGAIKQLSELAQNSILSFGGVDQKFQNIGSGLMAGMKQGISLNTIMVTTQILSMIAMMTEAFSGIEDKFKGIGKSIVNGLNLGIISSIGVITAAMSSIGSVADGLSSSLYQSGKSAAQSFANGFRNVHIPVPHIGISRYTRYDLGDSSFSMPSFKVNWYKMGGVFTKASLVGVGEAGKEAVLPLENKRTMSMITNSMLDSVPDGMGISKDELRQAVAEGVAMAMMNNQGNQTPITVYAELRTESDEVLARAVTRGQRNIDYRMNPVSRFG